MKKILTILFLLLSSPLWAAAPTRQYNYIPSTVIDPSQVSANENVIFTYLQTGVDTYAPGSISNATISASAGIVYSKLTLAGSIVDADISPSAAILGSKLDLTSPGPIGSVAPNTGAFLTLAATDMTGSTLMTAGNVGIGTSTATGGRLMVQGGNVGIGTVTATKALTVNGTIYSTSGGVQFPDNTTQTTASPNTFKFVSKTSVSGAMNTGDIAISNTKYYVVTIHMSAFQANGTGLWFLFNNDTGSNYDYINRGFDTATTASNSNASGAAQILVGPQMRATGVNAILYIFPEDSNHVNLVQGKVWGDFQSTTTWGYVDIFGKWSNSAAATSFRISTDGSLNTITGDVTLYEIQQQ